MVAGPAPTGTPPAVGCVFHPMSGPACRTDPTIVVSAGVTRSAGPGDGRVGLDGAGTGTGGDFGGFGMWGGQEGAGLCMGYGADGSVSFTNGDQVVLVQAAPGPLLFAGRTQLVRSFAVWGAVRDPVAGVIVTDPGAPRSVAQHFIASGGGTSNSRAIRFFLQPITGVGPVTVTALDRSGEVVGVQVVT